MNNLLVPHKNSKIHRASRFMFLHLSRLNERELRTGALIQSLGALKSVPANHPHWVSHSKQIKAIKYARSRLYYIQRRHVESAYLLLGSTYHRAKDLLLFYTSTMGPAPYFGLLIEKVQRLLLATSRSHFGVLRPVFRVNCSSPWEPSSFFSF